jgi:uncharacterized membrane protein
VNLPCLRAGSSAVHPHGEIRVQVGVEGLERSLESRRQRGERLLGVAAGRGARAANGGTGGLSAGLCWIGGVFGGVLIVLVYLVVIIALYLVVVIAGLPCCRGGDVSGQSEGGDEREDGFVEEHFKRMKCEGRSWSSKFFVCSRMGY